MLEKERDGLQALYVQLSAQYAEAARQQEELRQSLTKEQELLNRGSQKQTELQEKLNGLEITSKERGMLQKAMQWSQMILSGEERKLKAQRELEQQREKIKAAQGAHERNSHEHHRLQEQEKQLAVRASLILAQAEDQGRLAEKSLLRLEDAEQNLRDELKQHQLRSLSLALAAELHDGQPCPVCGSLEHPEPAHPEAGEADRQEETLRQIQGFKVRLQEFKYAQRQLAHECSSLAVLEPGNGSDALDQAAAGIEQPEAAAASGLFPALMWEEQIRALESAGEQLAGELASLKGDSLRLGEQREELQRLALRQAAETEAGSAVLEQLTQRLEQLSDEVQQLKDKWAEELDELPLGEVEKRWSEMQQKDHEAEDIKERLRRSVPFLEEKKHAVQTMERNLLEAEKQSVQLGAQLQGKKELLNEKQDRLQAWIGDKRAEALLQACAGELKALREAAAREKQLRQSAEQAKHESARAYAMASQAADSSAAHHEAAGKRWEKLLSDSPFTNEQEVEEAHIPPQEADRLAEQVRIHRDRERDLLSAIKHIEEQLLDASLTDEEWQQVTRELSETRQADEEALQAKARAERDLEDIKNRHIRWMELEKIRLQRQHEAEKLSKLQSCLRGNAFVEYIAEEQLMQVSQSASQRLRFLTKQRYALEVDSGGGFLIRDDANGGVRRPVSTLSGGETFLTSLSLALALSAQIQLRGQYPLQFFFLDEGFGTLDPDLLDTVISSLEKLHNDHLSVGIISHVPELRARLPRKLVVIPAEQAGGGSKIAVEQM